jgi:hypothetical protein
MQLDQIQTGRIEIVRWPAKHDCAAAGSVHVLLAAVLLVYVA